MTASLVLLAALCAAANPPQGDAWTAMEPATRKRLLGMSPPPSPPPNPTNRLADDPRAAELGQALFFDPRLSRDGTISCATCHDPALGFADGRVRAKGLAEGPRHTPSVLDAATQRWLTWDGRADSLWAQALHPFESPLEMGSTRQQVLAVVREDARLRPRFEALFGAVPPADAPGEEIDCAFAAVGKALEAYERRLLSSAGPFDEFVRVLREDPARESEAAEAYGLSASRGALIFAGKAGCHRCHRGPALSDGEFHRLGIPGSLEAGDRGRLDGVRVVKADPFNAAGACSDEREGERAAVVRALAEDPDLFGRVRTPSLRAAARTAPYMHDGSMATLADVLRFYNTLEGAVQDHHGETILAPLGLSPGELEDIEAFLRSLAPALPSPELCRPPAWMGRQPG